MKQQRTTFYDSGPAHPMFSRIPKSSGIQAGTVTQEGYNTSAIEFSRGAGGGVALTHGRAIRACEITPVISCDEMLSSCMEYCGFFSPMTVNPMDSFSLYPFLLRIAQLHLGDTQEVRIPSVFLGI